MQVRVIQWNVKIGSNSRKICDFLKSKIEGHTIINLQEVSEQAAEEIAAALAIGYAYSLHLRRPGKFEGKNRKMGVMTLVSGGEILSKSLIESSVFPERTLVTTVLVAGMRIENLTFHSLTGVDYKKAKSSNFASIASYLDGKIIDLITCDANEPKVDSLLDEDLQFFDNRDKGKNAALLFGASRVHGLVDSYKSYAKRSSLELSQGFTHITGKKERRYDFIYCRPDWNIVHAESEYSESINATSDHAIVISDLDTVSDG